MVGILPFSSLSFSSFTVAGTRLSPKRYFRLDTALLKRDVSTVSPEKFGLDDKTLGSEAVISGSILDNA